MVGNALAEDGAGPIPAMRAKGANEMEDIEYLNVVNEDVEISGKYEIGDVFIQKESPAYAKGYRNTRKIMEVLVDAQDRVFYRFNGERSWHDGEHIFAEYEIVVASRCRPML